MIEEITQEQSEKLCWSFHKLARVSDYTQNLDLWNAINNLKDDNYLKLMEWALSEIGIKVKKNF